MRLKITAFSRKGDIIQGGYKLHLIEIFGEKNKKAVILMIGNQKR